MLFNIEDCRNRLKEPLKKWRIHLGVVAFIFGFVAVLRCAAVPVTLQSNTFEATFYVLAWTFGPPAWFALESWVLSGESGLEQGQKSMSALWAAVLAAILFLVKP